MFTKAHNKMDLSAEQRTSMVTSFNKRSRSVLIISQQVNTDGINLQESCRLVVIMDIHGT